MPLLAKPQQRDLPWRTHLSWFSKGGIPLAHPAWVWKPIDNYISSPELYFPRKGGHPPLANGHIWQARFYDFVVFTEKKRVEKLRYMHGNPVKRGLVLEPQQWAWSSYRSYASGELGAVQINDCPMLKMTIRAA